MITFYSFSKRLQIKRKGLPGDNVASFIKKEYSCAGKASLSLKCQYLMNDKLLFVEALACFFSNNSLHFLVPLYSYQCMVLAKLFYWI